MGHLSPERARAETGGADQRVLKRREFPGFAIVNEKKRPHPWDTHDQFSIKTNKSPTFCSQHVARSRRQSSRSSRRTFPSPHILHSLSAFSKMNTIPCTPNQLEYQNSVFMCASICSRPSANETKPLRGTKQISLNLSTTCTP